MKMSKLTMLCGLFLVGLVQACVGQEVTKKTTTDPSNASLVYRDVENFIRAQKMLANTSDTLGVLIREYFDKGTPGLKMFIEKYSLTPEKLLAAIREHPQEFSSLHDLPGGIDAMRVETHRAFAKLKEIIPQVKFPPTYFLIGEYWTMGSGSIEGQLVTVEKWSVPIEGKMPMLIHELIHFQQVLAVGYEKYKKIYDEEKSLLGLCIREGTAEFFANLVTGEITQSPAREYTLENQARLWPEFLKVMLEPGTGDWMWSRPKDSAQPAHIGYVLGMLIVQSYYDRMEDKKQAVKDILGVTDYLGFLESSGYALKFQN